MNRIATFAALAAIGFASGCSSSSGATGPSGHSLTLNATMAGDAGQLAFMTPSASVIDEATDTVVGKPYLIAAFPAGFSPGNDPPLDHVWGTVPADLSISYTTPSTYKDGAYDVVLVVYVSTPITAAIQAAPAQSAPAAKKGDLSTFTIDTSVVKTGDPSIVLGTVRFNVEGADTTVSVANRTPQNPSDSTEVTAALANTIMATP